MLMNSFYARFGKRCLDLTVSFMCLVVLAPLMLFIAALVSIRLGRPVIFCQQRPGQNAEPFWMFKFRTMTNATDADGHLLPDARRLTRFGRGLRRSSFDELPELWNVLRGDMSLVGPRPLLTRYTEYFTEPERERFAVKPGITGLAQINGRNAMTWNARIAADLEYVQNLSFRSDLIILIQTIKAIFSRRGLHDDPSSVMLNFDEERRQNSSAAQHELVRN
jgi:undecaprenyl phosphate N,N'-diacetylbacillosamine 1-phosphate transferase